MDRVNKGGLKNFLVCRENFPEPGPAAPDTHWQETPMNDLYDSNASFQAAEAAYWIAEDCNAMDEHLEARDMASEILGE